MMAELSRQLRRAARRPRAWLFALSAFCLGQAGLLALHNKLLALGEGPCPDLRHAGYTAAELAQLLEAWGPEGRRTYAQLEAVDVAPYMWGYAALLSFALSLGSDVVPAEPLRRVNLLPWLAALADLAENGLMLGMLAAWPSATAALAPYAALASRAKWGLLWLTVSTLLGLGGFNVYVAAGHKRKMDGGGRGGAAAAAAASGGRGGGGSGKKKAR